MYTVYNCSTSQITAAIPFVWSLFIPTLCRLTTFIVFRNRFLCGFMFVYIIIIYIIYVYICQDGGAVGFVDFTKLSFALSSLAQPFDQMGSVPEHVFVILSQRKAYAGRFQKRTGPMTKWSPRRLLFTRLEIVFVTISSFTKLTKVVPKVFQEDECCSEGLINLACGLQLQMLPKLNGHFMNVLVWFCT